MAATTRKRTGSNMADNASKWFTVFWVLLGALVSASFTWGTTMSEMAAMKEKVKVRDAQFERLEDKVDRNERNTIRIGSWLKVPDLENPK